MLFIIVIIIIKHISAIILEGGLAYDDARLRGASLQINEKKNNKKEHQEKQSIA